MPKYRWTIEFDADNDKEADEIVEDAMDSFHSIHTENVEQIGE